MAETKLFAVPAEWPAPEFALGETVYRVLERPLYTPKRGTARGLVYQSLEAGMTPMYSVRWDTYWQDEEYLAEELTRETWVPTCTPAVVSTDDFDPFMDSDDLP